MNLPSYQSGGMIVDEQDLTPKFEFDPIEHIYTLNGKPLTGVTSVLGVIAKPALIQWSANEAVKHIEAEWRGGVLYTKVEVAEILKSAKTAHRKKKDDAASRGTDTHQLLEDIIKHAIVKSSGVIQFAEHDDPQVTEFLKWARDNHVRFLESEKRMYSVDHWLAGTCDFVAIVNGKKLVGDIKTTSGIYDLTPFMQCAAYRMMLEEMGERDFEGSVIIRLGKDGSFEERYRFDYDTDRMTFIAALDLYRGLATYTK